MEILPMSATLERNQVIELLDKLGSEPDEDVLAAARMLHSQITESGMGWDDLLVGDEPEVEEEVEVDSLPDENEDIAEDTVEPDSLPDEGDENDDIAEDTVEPDTRFTCDDTQTLSLIEILLARNGISSEFREELEEYKTDISDGIFESSDHRYVHAVYARLTKN
jgi:hypothetical protein